MSVHLRRQIESLKQMIVSFARDGEAVVAQAIDAVERRDVALARKIIENDDVIDRREVDIEEECLHTLACYQPVAADLRYVIVVLKMNNDLERMADLASSLAEQAIFLADYPPVELASYLDGMADHVQMMLRRSLDALLHVDIQTAEEVCADDDRVDHIHVRMYELVETAMRRDPERIPQLIRMVSISRYLERIADLATNIAEDVIYLARGEISRHAAAQQAARKEPV